MARMFAVVDGKPLIDLDFPPHVIEVVDETHRTDTQTLESEAPVVYFRFANFNEVRLPPREVASMGSREPYTVAVSIDPDKWSLAVSDGYIEGPSGLARLQCWFHDKEEQAPDGLENHPAYDHLYAPFSERVPHGLTSALRQWLNRTFFESKATPVFRLAEEMAVHLRRSLSDRRNLLERLSVALGDKNHAEERVAALEQQLVTLEAQLREATAAIANDDRRLADQSKTSLVAMATMVLSMLAIAATVTQPYISNRLSNDDTQALIVAQQETTMAIEALDNPSPLDRTVDVALRCIIEAKAPPR